MNSGAMNGGKRDKRPQSASAGSTGTAVNGGQNRVNRQHEIKERIEEYKKERQNLRVRLDKYQKEFLRLHNRKIKYRNDIKPVADEFKRYKDLKDEI